MPVPGTVWASDTWVADAWAADTWADASAGDSTAPVLSNAAAAAAGSTTGTGSVETDESGGTLYWVVTQTDTAPSAAQVKAGQDDQGASADADGSQAVTGTGVQNVIAGGLSAETGYYFHFMHEDAAANQSNVDTSNQFTTSASGGTSVGSGGSGSQTGGTISSIRRRRGRR